MANDAFGESLRLFAEKMDGRVHDVFIQSASDVHESIKEGSQVTGAPGQPVDTGFLKGSWILEFESDTVAVISTNVSYAPVIEEGVRDAYDPEGVDRPPRSELGGGTNRKGPSVVGGHHSVAMTRNGWQWIAEAARDKVVGND